MMEYMLTDLQEVIKQGLLISEPGDIARGGILRIIGKALVFLKEKHVIHADLQPSNVLISGTGFVKLCDFGRAKRLPEGEDHLISNNENGSLKFMAPEMLVNGNRLDFGIDVWAFGMVAVAMHEAERAMYFDHPPMAGRFSKDHWKIWARGPEVYFFDIFGIEFCLPGAHDRWKRSLIARATMKRTRSGRANTVKNLKMLEKRNDYANLLRKCLIPNTDSCPQDIKIRHGSLIVRETIEDVLQSKYFSSRNYTEHKERVSIVRVIKGLAPNHDVQPRTP